MQQLAKSLPVTKPSQQSTAVSTSFGKPSVEQLAVARDTLKTLLKGRPDTNAENPKYLAEMVECLSWLTPEEHRWLAHPRDGLQTVCKFLPTPADVHQFLRERQAKAEQFKPAPTVYRKIEDDPNAPWNQETDAERKKRVVQQYLGYNPDKAGSASRQNLVPPSNADLASLDLKTPSAPPSEYLKRVLRAQGYPNLKDDAQ